MSDQARELAAQLAPYLERAKAWLDGGHDLSEGVGIALEKALAEEFLSVAQTCYEKAAQHKPYIRWDRDGEIYDVGCSCGAKFSMIAIGGVDDWTEEYAAHILALAGSPTPAMERHDEPLDNALNDAIRHGISMARALRGDAAPVQDVENKIAVSVFASVIGCVRAAVERREAEIRLTLPRRRFLSRRSQRTLPETQETRRVAGASQGERKMNPCCEYEWTTDDPCELDKHACMKDEGHLGPHVCTCGERDKIKGPAPKEQK